MNWIRRHRPSPGTAFGAAALMIALGGVAFAAIPDSSGTIHGCYQKSNGNLRVVDSASECRNTERAIAWNQEGPPGSGGLAGVISDEESGEVSTESDGYLDLGGPCATVTVPDTGLVSVFARAELRAGSGGGAVVGLFESGEINPAGRILASAEASFERKWSAPGVSIFNFSTDPERGPFGTALRSEAGFATVETSPGVRTFCLRYRSVTRVADTAYFRERKLWVAPIG